MSDTRQLYHRLDRWVRNLSRIQYAILGGVTSALSVLAIGFLLSDSVIFGDISMVLPMTVVYYAWNPNQED